MSFFFFLRVTEFFVFHRMVGRTWRGVLTPGYFEPCNFPSLIWNPYTSLRPARLLVQKLFEGALCPPHALTVRGYWAARYLALIRLL